MGIKTILNLKRIILKILKKMKWRKKKKKVRKLINHKLYSLKSLRKMGNKLEITDPRKMDKKMVSMQQKILLLKRQWRRKPKMMNLKQQKLQKM